MVTTIKNYFACANSSRGFYNFFDSNLQHLNRIYILKGGPGTGKSTLMKKIGAHFYELGYSIEFIRCSSDVTSLDGVIIPDLSVAIVDGTAPHIIEPKAPGAIEEYVNLGLAWDSDLLTPHKETILSLKKQIDDCYQRVYEAYAEALKVHDEWEKIYIDEMNFDIAPAFRDFICQTLLNYKPSGHQAIVKHRFFGCSSPTGPVDYIQDLTENLDKRYFIKGRPGTGKSTLLKQIASTCESLGYDTEIYHCAFDPESLDMVLIPELRICFFDSTAPHEYFPDLKNDEVIDMYEALITPGTDEKFEEELKEIATRYKETVAKGTQALKEAKQLHDELEKYYIDAVNFDLVQAIYVQLKHNIELLAK